MERSFSTRRVAQVSYAILFSADTAQPWVPHVSWFSRHGYHDRPHHGLYSTGILIFRFRTSKLPAPAGRGSRRGRLRLRKIITSEGRSPSQPRRLVRIYPDCACPPVCDATMEQEICISSPAVVTSGRGGWAVCGGGICSCRYWNACGSATSLW